MPKDKPDDKKNAAESLLAQTEFGVGESEPFQTLTKERLVGELFTGKDRQRKTRIPNVFNHTMLNMLALHLSDKEGIGKILEEKVSKRVLDVGDYTRAFAQLYETFAYSHQGLARAEYITALAGVGESDEDKLKAKRVMEGIIGV
jgi:hypothetical protein